MSPSYEMYRNLETYPVGCFIIYFYVSVSRIFRFWMRWKYHSALIAINPNIWYNTADIYSSAYQMAFLHTIRRCKVEYDHISVRHSYAAYTVCGLHIPAAGLIYKPYHIHAFKLITIVGSILWQLMSSA